jgi:hypothetical protein
VPLILYEEIVGGALAFLAKSPTAESLREAHGRNLPLSKGFSAGPRGSGLSGDGLAATRPRERCATVPEPHANIGADKGKSESQNRPNPLR